MIEEAKKRCEIVENRIQTLPNSKITDNCKQTLVRLVNSELKFLNRISISPHPSTPISVNIGYLESIVYILQQPYITGVSRVCKPIPISSEHGKKNDSRSKGVHVDIVCNLHRNPVWFVVSDRNPKYISWSDSHGNKGLRTRIDQILYEARSSFSLKPASLILFFSNGLDGVVSQKLVDEFGALECGNELSLTDDADFSEELEDGWVNVRARTYQKSCAFKIEVDNFVGSVDGVRDGVTGDAKLGLSEYQAPSVFGDEFSSLITRIRCISLNLESARPESLFNEDLINFDTTSLVALVSGISNGGAEKLLAAPEYVLKERFKSNFEFVIAQAKSELLNPILVEMSDVISGKIGLICETVRSEFMELVSMCGGPNEMLRAKQLLKHLLIVPDTPSVRMVSLLTTRKIAMKNKIVFGTGDYWKAPTLTANMGFVRAISQTGMSLLTLEHRPRALTGD